MEKIKKQSERTCAVCRKKASKDQFIKIVRENGEIKIDREQKINGRGMYICKTGDCIVKAVKTKAVNRVFKKDISENIYEELKTLEESK